MAFCAFVSWAPGPTMSLSLGTADCLSAWWGCSQDKHKTRHELKRLARNAAELMGLSAALEAGGIQLELLTGPLTGVAKASVLR
jgi:hypothetical protein